MKAVGKIALVVAGGLVLFMAGAYSGMGGLVLGMFFGYVLLITVPLTAAILGVLAGAFWLGAKTSGSKARWDIYGKISAVIMAMTVTGSAIFVVHAMMNVRMF